MINQTTLPATPVQHFVPLRRKANAMNQREPTRQGILSTIDKMDQQIKDAEKWRKSELREGIAKKASQALPYRRGLQDARRLLVNYFKTHCY